MKIKRFLALMLLCALMLSFSAYADIAYTPSDDFYDAHWDECDYEDSYYITNSPLGSLNAYSSPTGSAKQSLPNGLEFYVSYTWSKGGVTWGCIEYDPETLESLFWQESESAWVDMSLMTPRYSSAIFKAEHSDALTNKLFSFTAEAGEMILLYRYPGSGIVEMELGYDGGPTTVEFGVSYIDAEGREWGYISYHYGIRDLWVCVDEPFQPLPAGAEFREPEIYPTASPEEAVEILEEAQGVPTSTLVLAGGLLIIAIALCAYIIIRKRKA